MQNKVLRTHPNDNVLVALTDLKEGDEVRLSGLAYALTSDVPAKHKFATEEMTAGDSVVMYGVPVGKAVETIHRKGSSLLATPPH